MEEDDLVSTLVSLTLLLTKVCKCLEIVDEIFVTVLLETPLIEFLSHLRIV